MRPSASYLLHEVQSTFPKKNSRHVVARNIRFVLPTDISVSQRRLIFWHNDRRKRTDFTSRYIRAVVSDCRARFRTTVNLPAKFRDDIRRSFKFSDTRHSEALNRGLSRLPSAILFASLHSRLYTYHRSYIRFAVMTLQDRDWCVRDIKRATHNYRTLRKVGTQLKVTHNLSCACLRLSRK